MDTAVRTVYGEAGNQPPEGQQAVAATLVNRAKRRGVA
jgi:spore germination cell wall hydrolase CwlJ-like protein